MNKKISELLETIDLNDEDILMILQSGQNKKIKAINAFKKINSKIDNINDTLIKVSPTEPSPKSDVWLKKGKNLFNKNRIVKNYYIKDTDGSISEYDSNMCYCFDYIEVSPNSQYTMSNTTATIFLIAEYDENKNFIKQNRQNDSNNFLSITTGETTKYIRISMGIRQINTIQFEAGEKTEYEAYIEPKVYVKDKNNENYLAFSRDKTITITDDIEFETGRIINGKKEYGLRFYFGPLPNNDAKDINVGYIYPITRISGLAIKNDGTKFLTIPNRDIKAEYENGWMTITTFENLSMFNATFEIYYIKAAEN